MTYSSEVINNKVILSDKSLYKNLHVKTSGISMWFERWFLSSNAKDIGVLYLIYALFSGLVGTAFSVLIRLELSGPGVQFIADNQLYNSIITAHAIIMIFFMVMPALIGGFGNFLLPLGLGGPDMGFPRLNNISYLSLIPSIVLFLFAGGIENGVGTGWTFNMEYSDQMTVLGVIKLFSMREYPLLFNGLSYSWLFKSYVTTLMTRGQYAWVAKKDFFTYQRLNKEYLVENKKECFGQRFVETTDGEGTFYFYKKNSTWVLHYKIAQSKYNLTALYYIKTNLAIGTIVKGNGKALLIRDRTRLNDVIFLKHYHTKINTFSANKCFLTDWIIPTSSITVKFFFFWVTRIIIHKVFRGLYKNNSGFFFYLLNKFKLYKLFNYIITFVYSIYVNIDKIILTYNGLCFFIIFGLLTEDPFSYYETLWLLYSVTMLKNYLKLTKNVLCNNPTIKTFLILFLDYVQVFLLGKILISIITNILSFLKNVLGYILKTNSPDNNNPENNNPENNNPHSHNNEDNNNGKGPNNHSNILTKEESDSEEDDREEAHCSTYIDKNTLSQYGEGVETSYDYKNRKISKIYWKNVFVDGKLKKQIEKTEYYNKKGVLYNSVKLKDGIEQATYKHKKSYIYR